MQTSFTETWRLPDPEQLYYVELDVEYLPIGAWLQKSIVASGGATIVSRTWTYNGTTGADLLLGVVVQGSGEIIFGGQKQPSQPTYYYGKLTFL